MFDVCITRIDLERALSVLPEREFEIIKKSFFDDWTLEECTCYFARSPERVRQYEAKALRILKKHFKKLDLRLCDF